MDRNFIKKYCNNLIMKDLKDCCQECQLENPFMKVGGSIIGKFAYTRQIPFIQPFETIDSPWADFIPSGIGRDLKALIKIAKNKGKTEKESNVSIEEEKKKPVPNNVEEEDEKSDIETENESEEEVEDDEVEYPEYEEWTKLAAEILEVRTKRAKDPNFDESIYTELVAKAQKFISTDMNLKTNTGGEYVRLHDIFKRLNSEFETQFQFKVN
jgi:hypothetical protein